MSSGSPSRKLPVPAHFINYGHRGHSSALPENTLAALESALEAGANAVEIDLRRTSDGVLVAFHDETLLRTTNGAVVFPGREHLGVEMLTLVELKQLDAGAWKGEHLAGHRVPTLVEVVEAVRGRATLVLDAKGTGTASAVATVLREAGFDPQCVVVFAAGEAIDEYHRNVPGAKLLAISHDPPTPCDEAFFQAQRARGVRGFSLNWQRLAGRLGFIAAAHAHDMIVHVWTVNESEEMRAALEAGVDGVGTDYPALLAEMIAVALPLESPGEMVQFKCG
jgi:glycerophosphoryl diester phosphodiesterase